MVDRRGRKSWIVFAKRVELKPFILVSTEWVLTEIGESHGSTADHRYRVLKSVKGVRHEGTEERVNQHTFSVGIKNAIQALAGGSPPSRRALIHPKIP